MPIKCQLPWPVLCFKVSRSALTHDSFDSLAFLPCDIRKIGARILTDYQSSQLPTPRLNQNVRDLLQLSKAVFYLGIEGGFFSFAVADICSFS
jgi:hypothetical protein